MSAAVRECSSSTVANPAGRGDFLGAGASVARERLAARAVGRREVEARRGRNRLARASILKRGEGEGGRERRVAASSSRIRSSYLVGLDRIRFRFQFRFLLLTSAQSLHETCAIRARTSLLLNRLGKAPRRCDSRRRSLELFADASAAHPQFASMSIPPLLLHPLDLHARQLHLDGHLEEVVQALGLPLGLLPVCAERE